MYSESANVTTCKLFFVAIVASVLMLYGTTTQAKVAVRYIEPGATETAFNISSAAHTIGYFTVHRGLGKDCGTAAQVRFGLDAKGVIAFRHGSLPMAAGEINRYVVHDLEQNSAYTLCLADYSESAPTTRNFATERLPGGKRHSLHTALRLGSHAMSAVMHLSRCTGEGPDAAAGTVQRYACGLVAMLQTTGVISSSSMPRTIFVAEEPLAVSDDEEILVD